MALLTPADALLKNFI